MGTKEDSDAHFIRNLYDDVWKFVKQISSVYWKDNKL